jgi:hypothetical protein
LPAPPRCSWSTAADEPEEAATPEAKALGCDPKVFVCELQPLSASISWWGVPLLDFKRGRRALV